MSEQRDSNSKHSLYQIATNYEELNIIGTGAYGTVYKARDLSNPGKGFVALKKVRVPLTDDGVPMSTLREIAHLKQIEGYSHPNIVKLLDVCHGQRLEREGQLVLFLVFEHMEQDLAGFLANTRNKVSKLTIQRLSNELLTGIDFLHSHRIVHRDLKPQNLLVSEHGNLKICDFGLAKTYDFEMRLTSVVVTLWYRAPEVLLSQQYNSSVDIWSTACIIAEIFQRRALFPGTSEANQLERIFELTGRPSRDEWPQGIPISRENFLDIPQQQPKDLCPKLCQHSNDLLNQMLAYKTDRRPSALECLQHPYFSEEPL